MFPIYPYPSQAGPSPIRRLRPVSGSLHFDYIVLMSSTILIVDDELEVCLSLGEVLRSRGYEVTHTDDPRSVLPLIEKNQISIIIMDVRMPNTGGIDLLQRVRERYLDIPVIMISGYASVENAVQAMKYGALNFFKKPIDLSSLLQEVERAELSAPRHRSFVAHDRVITLNSHMQHVLSLARKAAPTDASVILTGESGTGKELLADMLHELSRRRDNVYVKLNCAAIPETLLESEMFGHEKGAFTDAHNKRKGKFEIADGGTLFLDEIGDMSLRTQAKMLRVLQEKRFTRVGGSEAIRTDFRVIAATNKDLTRMTRSGQFREDLFYRLSVIVISVPPLRERPEDIIPLAEEFRQRFNGVYGKAIKGFSPDVRTTLQKHDWPGNVRELKNVIERAVIFCETDYVDLADLPEQYHIVSISRREPEESLSEFAAENARSVILEALKRSHGVKGEAARMLNITRKTLYNRMKKLDLK